MTERVTMFIHDLLRAKAFKKRTSRSQPVRYIQQKLDGWRMCVFVQKDGSLYATGKDQSEHLEFLTRFPRLQKDSRIQTIRSMPPLSSIELEIMVPGQPAAVVATALRDESIPILIQSFAVPFYNGEDLRLKSLFHAQSIAHEHGVSFAEFHSIHVDDPVDEQEWLNKAIEVHYEGWIAKTYNYEGWWKIKVEDSMDVIVTGVNPGQGKYEGQVGALVVAVYRNGRKTDIATVSGMTDDERLAFTRKPPLGQVIEIKFQERTAGGRLRHPRFIRLRPDKPAKECIDEQS